MTKLLATNGLLMPADFPVAAYERVHVKLQARAANLGSIYDHFGGAWNAISIRYLALVDEGDAFSALISAPGSTNAQDRYRQEKSLFGFFGNGFSTLEAYFYGLYAIGAALQPAHFPLVTPRDQQSVSPTKTQESYAQAFPGDVILTSIQSLFTDPAYREWKQVRNVLTHRTAPGRTLFVSVDADTDLPPVWKLNNITLDAKTAPLRRAQLSKLLTMLLEAAAAFVDARLP
jgi:hypothetical protein